MSVDEKHMNVSIESTYIDSGNAVKVSTGPRNRGGVVVGMRRPKGSEMKFFPP